MEKDFSKDVLEKIKKEQIKPRSRWHFMLKDYVVWLVFVASIISGSISFSVILYFLETNDWDAYRRVSNSFLAFFLLTMPYFWLVCFAVFLLIAFFYLKNTRQGYKYEFVKVVLASLALSLVFGSVFYALGTGKKTENEFARRSPFYENLRDRQAYVWFNPDQGVIIGKVREIDEGEDFFKLSDPYETIWIVNTSKAVYAPNFQVREGFVIKVFGKKVDDNSFDAEEIRPLMRDREFGIEFLPPPGR